MLFSTFERPLPTTTTMDTPPRRKRGAEVSLGRRYAMQGGYLASSPSDGEDDDGVIWFRCPCRVLKYDKLRSVVVRDLPSI